jgi:predicted DsbA family dithiol-disulfide isomerase/uncharacterized membrane protein
LTWGARLRKNGESWATFGNCPDFWWVFSGKLLAPGQFAIERVVRLPWLTALRVAALVALSASAALLSDYVAGAPSFCSAASGCGAVRASELSHFVVGGVFVPLPALGVASFVALLAASLWSQRVTLLAAAAGGAAGAFLLATQAFVIQRFCWLCVTTDLAALVAAVAAFQLRCAAWPADARAGLRVEAWWSLGALALLSPIGWPQVRLGPPVPAAVLGYYQAGKINVVEFADFECPACRRFSSILKDALAPYAERVHFVRLNKPLASHEFAAGAARAAVCAEAQHRAEAMADALFATDDLSAAGIARLWQQLGLDPKQLEACLADPATLQRVEQESGLLVPPDFEGLPTTYIGGKRLLGVQSFETVSDALERAARGEGARGVSGYVYVPVVLLLLLAIVRFGLRRPLT